MSLRKNLYNKDGTICRINSINPEFHIMVFSIIGINITYIGLL